MLWLTEKQTTGLIRLLPVLLLVSVLITGVMATTTAHAKRNPKNKTTSPITTEQTSVADPLTTSTANTLNTTQPAVTSNTKPPKRTKTRNKQQAAQLSTVEFEPPPNPDYPMQLCGARRQRLVALQSLPLVVRPFFLAQRKVEHWQYRVCLSRTMPEVQRYLETFPVPYEAPIINKPVSSGL
jgi:hypothetical protein